MCVCKCVCGSVFQIEGSSRCSLEAPPFHQPVIYRFKEHLTIDYKVFPSRRPAKAENKAQ